MELITKVCFEQQLKNCRGGTWSCISGGGGGCMWLPCAEL